MIRHAILAALAAAGLAAHAADANKVLRYAFEVAETSFDPPRISDLYSNIVNGAMFDAPLAYDYLARPSKLKPNTAAGLPEVSADGLPTRSASSRGSTSPTTRCSRAGSASWSPPTTSTR
jgi:hypothetical protein